VRRRDPACASRSITEIAFDSGFADVAHFNRAFRKRRACTPGEWRRGGTA
jgi:AraC-like DNA-binding protein